MNGIRLIGEIYWAIVGWTVLAFDSLFEGLGM